MMNHKKPFKETETLMGANHQPLTLDRRPITRNTLHWQHFEEYKNILKSVEYTQRYTYLANALLGC